MATKIRKIALASVAFSLSTLAGCNLIANLKPTTTSTSMASQNTTTIIQTTTTKKIKTTVKETREMTNHAVYDGVALPDTLWETPEYYWEEELDRKETDIKGSIKAMYYRSDYNGIESYAFAYLGIPEGAEETKNYPAVLLVHGGGGTAYYEWVREWVNRGYVALAMDLEGHVPKYDSNASCGPQDLYTKSQYTATSNQNYGDASKPIEQTWMYYAVSTSILGNSLLHSLDYVDNQSIGVCGVSWGGVITSIITGYDDRFAFSIPIYGSLNNAESSGNIAGYYKNHPEAKVWDIDEGLSNVSTPIYFLDMNNDIHFFPDSIMATYDRCENPKVSFVKNWLHSQVHAMSREEPYLFADEIVKGKKTLIDVIDMGEGLVKLKVPEGVTVKAAYLMVTDSNLNSTIPTWNQKRLQVVDEKIEYEITDEVKEMTDSETVTYYYIYVEDTLGRVVSTNLIEY